MNVSSLNNLKRMHVVKAQLKAKTRKRGQILRKMEMVRAYSTRLRPIPTDITTL